MSIVDTINDIKLNVENAYTSLENKGATIPSKKNIQNLSSTIESIKSGGGDNPIQNSGGKYLVRVVDYDGTILKEDHLDSGATFTLPNVPTHDRLVFEEWSCPIDIVNNTITIPNHDVVLGAIYSTTSGLTEFDITINQGTGLTITLNMNGTKEWGDGTSNESTSHTYSEAGNYTIKCDGNSLSQTGSLGVFGQGSNNINYSINSILLSSNIIIIPDYAFQYCYHLKSVSFPKILNLSESDRLFYITKQRIFYNCRSLTTLILPNTTKSYLGTYLLYSCYLIENVVIPRNYWLNSSTYCFYNCDSLRYIYLPYTNNTTLPNAIFYSCYSLKRLKLPKQITTISQNALANLHTCEELDFSDFTAIPSLADVNVLSNLSKRCKIIVPASLYSTWKTATNWTTYANRIYSAG